MSRVAWFSRRLKLACGLACVLCAAAQAHGQLQVELNLKRLQYIAYEPIVATLAITNLAGRDVDLHDADGQTWFGFEVTGKEGEPITPTRKVKRHLMYERFKMLVDAMYDDREQRLIAASAAV